MSFDRRRSNGCARIFIVLLIIAFGVVAIPQLLNVMGVRIGGNTAGDGPIPTQTPLPVAPDAGLTPVSLLGTPVSPAPAPRYRLVAEKANLETLITEVYFSNSGDWDLTYLRDLAGHLEGTPQFGRGGNFVLAGHVELEGGLAGPFVNLKNLKIGDTITILRAEASVEGNSPLVVRYAVTETKHVAPNDINVIKSRGYEELTLLTCDDFDFTTNQYATRFIVHARPVTDLQNLALTPTLVLQGMSPAQ